MRGFGVRQILIVSHDDELVGAADELVTVEKDPRTNRSTVRREDAADPTPLSSISPNSPTTERAVSPPFLFVRNGCTALSEESGGDATTDRGSDDSPHPLRRRARSRLIRREQIAREAVGRRRRVSPPTRPPRLGRREAYARPNEDRSGTNSRESPRVALINGYSSSDPPRNSSIASTATGVAS